MTMRPQHLIGWLTALTLAVAGLAISPAAALAGTKAHEEITKAEALNIGESESGGGHAIDFWRVHLAGGDRVVVNLKAPDGYYNFDLYSPETTDSTFLEDPPVDHVAGYGEDQVILQAPYNGDFVLAVCENTGDGDCRQYATSGTKPMEPYTFDTALEAGGVPEAVANAETRATETIASSSALTVGNLEAGGGENVDFWHVRLAGGDRVVVNLKAPDGYYNFDLYSPETTDSTFLEDPPVDHVAGYGEDQVILQAPYNGDFVLAVCENTGDGDCRQYATSGTKPMEPYTFDTALEAGGVPEAVANAETRATETIASSSALTVGNLEAGGGENVDFWRIALTGGSAVVIDLKGPAAYYDFDLYSPETTDSTFLENPPVANVAAYGEDQVILQAPYSGNFVLAVCENTGDGDCRQYATSGTRPMEPYVFTTSLEGGGESSTPSGSPSTSGSGTPSTPSASVSVARRSAAVSNGGVAALSLTCADASCTGTFKLIVHIKETVRLHGKRKSEQKAVTIGTAALSGLSVGVHSISIKLTSLGLHLLKQDGNKLSVTASVTFRTGSTVRTISAPVTLVGAKPKKGVPIG